MFKEELIPLAPSQNQLRQDIRFLSRLLAETIREQEGDFDIFDSRDGILQKSRSALENLLNRTSVRRPRRGLNAELFF